jgi:hypothetical protein
MAAQTIAFELAVTALHHENQESQRQLMIDMQTFQMNMIYRVVACQQIRAYSLILNALDACIDNPPASTVMHPVDTKSATKPYTCNRTRYSYSTMSTRSISINISPCIRKTTLHPTFMHVVFGYDSLSNVSYADPPLLQPHCLNLPPSRAKKKGV